MRGVLQRIAVGLVAWTILCGSSVAEKVKVAVGQRGNWDTSICELGQRAGIFAKHDLDLDILYTDGGGQTLQAVLSRGVQIGVAPGTLGVLAAAARGAPLRIISAEATGASDLYWYVPANSPIKQVTDLAGHTVAFSTIGSSSQAVLLAQRALSKSDFKPVATGGASATYTQVMSGQVDVGWANPPFGVEHLNKDIRIIFRGSDIPDLNKQTIRVNIVHAADAKQYRDMIDRFLAAYGETVTWMYNGTDALALYAKMTGVPVEVAQRTRDDFFPKSALSIDRLSGLDQVMADGVALKFMPKSLPPEQLNQLILNR